MSRWTASERARMQERLWDLWVWLPLRSGWQRAIEECELAALFQEFVNDGRVWVFKPEPFMENICLG